MHEPLESNQARFFVLSGHVQGVGFRPFVYRLAQQYHIHGWVENWMGQVAIHAEGNADYLQTFQENLIKQAPPHASPVISRNRIVDCKHYAAFSIRRSNEKTPNTIRIVTDLPVCDDCLHELNDAADRRYRYPFINCTHCGPRYTLIRQLPYDRANTTMAEFPLCPQCKGEYENAADRRYHAEPIACSDCGPALSFTHQNKTIAGNEQALQACITALRKGKIVAVKGIGGYHLMADSCNDAAVAKLRERKPRPHKPLAVMMAAQDLSQYVIASEDEQALLSGVEHPILLLTQKPGNVLSKLIAPKLTEVGVMLPYSPLHYLLLKEFSRPLVATSANISGEPVLTDNDDVVRRLSHVADAGLHHNRPIQRPADDPVYRVINNKPRAIRLGRGNAPLELNLPFTIDRPSLAVGGHMKNTIALAWENNIVVSPHIGELDSLRSQQVFAQVIADLQALYQITAERVVCDAHPKYSSSEWARKSGLEVVSVYHHHAHASCVSGEFPGEKNWLVFAWDGTGFGPDNTIWGGEALLGNSGSWHQVASLRQFHLPGGDRAAREPWRSAAALCWEASLTWSTSHKDLDMLQQAWQKRINCPLTSSAGRLFDAAAALIGLVDTVSFEGQAPMWLEALAQQGSAEGLSLEMEQDDQGVWRADWQWLLEMLMDNRHSQADRARCFHETMALVILHQALQVREQYGDFAVGLSGGVFQNRILTERAIELLEQHDFRCYFPEHVPVNDGGLCYGQIVEAHGVTGCTKQ
ncbi:carbamoyltransferase HypF [Kaarinaea lacus]